MRILSVDPGAERCGITILDDNPLKRVYSAILGIHRNDEPYQAYRLQLVKWWQFTISNLFEIYKPEVLVNEIIPAPQGSNFGALAQMNLAATVITTIQSIAYMLKLEVHQIAANKVKNKIGGSGNASKVKVRNGVYTILPETKTLTTNNWSKVFDESDAFAVGLTYLGYNIKDVKTYGSKKQGSAN